MKTDNETALNGHEARDIDVPALFMVALLLALSGIVIFLIVGLVMHSFERREPSKIAGQANLPLTQTSEFPPPRLIIKPGGDLSSLRSAEEQDLTSSGWIDRNAGVVRIPIDRAMQLLLQRGLPETGGGQTPLSLMQARPNETATPPRLMNPQ